MSVFAEPKKIRAVFKVNRGAGAVVNVNAKSALMFAFACSGGITRGKSFGFCAGVTLFLIALNGGFKKVFLIIIAPVSAGDGYRRGIRAEVIFHSVDKHFKRKRSFFCNFLRRSAVGTG